MICLYMTLWRCSGQVSAEIISNNIILHESLTICISCKKLWCLYFEILNYVGTPKERLSSSDQAHGHSTCIFFLHFLAKYSRKIFVHNRTVVFEKYSKNFNFKNLYNVNCWYFSYFINLKYAIIERARCFNDEFLIIGIVG